MQLNLRRRVILIIFTVLAFIIFIELFFSYKLHFTYFSLKDYPALFMFSFLFLYLTDNTSIRYYGPIGKQENKYHRVRLITNLIGFMPMLAIFGPKVSCIALIVTRFLRFNEDSADKLFLRKIRGTVYYFIYYSISAIVYDYFISLNVLLSLSLFVIIFKLLNILVLYVEDPKTVSLGERFHGSLNDLPLFLMNVPSIYVIYEIYHSPDNIPKFVILGYYFSCVVFLLYWSMTKYRSNYNSTLLEHRKLLNIKMGLENVLQVFKTIRASKPFEQFLEDVAKIVAEFSECKYVLMSIFNYEKGTAERVASYGIDENEFKRLAKNPPTIEEVKNLLRPEFKISNSYFIPEGAIGRLDENKTFIGEYELDDDEDTWKPLDLFIIPIRNVNNEIIGYVSLDGPRNKKRPTVEQVKILEIFMEQIAGFLESSKQYSATLNKALTDGLTGLYNHSYFYNYLEKTIKSTLDGEKELSIIVLDLDNFKKINDEFGHLFGDIVLKRIAEILRSSVRDIDTVCRYGGDEFAIILPDVSKSLAKEVAERLLEKIRSIRFREGTGDVYLTASAGISSFPEDGSNAIELFESADKALYISKTLGKDTVTA